MYKMTRLPGEELPSLSRNAALAKNAAFFFDDESIVSPNEIESEVVCKSLVADGAGMEMQKSELHKQDTIHERPSSSSSTWFSSWMNGLQHDVNVEELIVEDNRDEHTKRPSPLLRRCRLSIPTDQMPQSPNGSRLEPVREKHQSNSSSKERKITVAEFTQSPPCDRNVCYNDVSALSCSSSSNIPYLGLIYNNDGFQSNFLNVHGLVQENKGGSFISSDGTSDTFTKLLKENYVQSIYTSVFLRGEQQHFAARHASLGSKAQNLIHDVSADRTSNDHVSSSDAVICIVYAWVVPGKEKLFEMAAKLRAVTMLQEPGASWVEQGVEYQDEILCQTNPGKSRLRYLHITCWQNYNLFRAFFLSPQSAKWFKDNLDLLVSETFEISQYKNVSIAHRLPLDNTSSLSKHDKQVFGPSSADCAISRKRPLTQATLVKRKRSRCKKENVPCITDGMAHYCNNENLCNVKGAACPLPSQYVATLNSKGSTATATATATASSINHIQHTISPFSDFMYKNFRNFFGIIIKIYPDPNQLDAMECLVGFTKMSAFKYLRTKFCLRFEALKSYKSEKALKEYAIYGIYKSSENFHHHLADMGEASLLGEKVKELSVQHPTVLPFRGEPIF